MNLIGNLKKTVEKVQTKEEAKDTIMKAGVLLKDEQLDLVAGGAECGICKSYGMMKLGTINRIVFRITDTGMEIAECGSHYGDH